MAYCVTCFIFSLCKYCFVSMFFFSYRKYNEESIGEKKPKWKSSSRESACHRSCLNKRILHWCVYSTHPKDKQATKTNEQTYKQKNKQANKQKYLHNIHRK